MNAEARPGTGGVRNAIDKPFDMPLLHTVHGIGYQLTEPPCD
ncbi:MAG: helix-turn-helix domain-containing protein [Gammaproteobacteria bacterium]